MLLLPMMAKAKRDFSRLSQSELAEVHRVSVRTIRTWTDWGMPRNKDGSYEIFATWEWRVARTEQDYRGVPGRVRRWD